MYWEREQTSSTVRTCPCDPPAAYQLIHTDHHAKADWEVFCEKSVLRQHQSNGAFHCFEEGSSKDRGYRSPPPIIKPGILRKGVCIPLSLRIMRLPRADDGFKIFGRVGFGIMKGHDATFSQLEAWRFCFMLYVGDGAFQTWIELWVQLPSVSPLGARFHFISHFGRERQPEAAIRKSSFVFWVVWRVDVASLPIEYAD